MEIVEKIHDIFLEEAKKSPILMSDLASMERYISESYTGRSLIELLQNADDACASKLIIKEIRKQVYLVANNGRTFDERDLEALCRSGASTKHRKNNTIGYRGIGFKSVVNYSNVALFFACCENIEKDAAIFIWSYSPYDPKWTRIKIQCELVNVKKQRISVSEYAEILLQKYPELKDNYTYKKDFYTDLVSYLDHGFMIMQPRNPYLENMRIQRQNTCIISRSC